MVKQHGQTSWSNIMVKHHVFGLKQLMHARAVTIMRGYTYSWSLICRSSACRRLHGMLQPAAVLAFAQWQWQAGLPV